MANIFNSKPINDVMFLVNGTGADLALDDFTVIAPYVCVANEVIANGASGTFTVKDGFIVESADLHATENTFGTLQAIVYFDPTSKKFSDTETAGYYPVGYLTKVKDSNGVIEFEKVKYTTVVPEAAE